MTNYPKVKELDETELTENIEFFECRRCSLEVFTNDPQEFLNIHDEEGDDCSQESMLTSQGGGGNEKPQDHPDAYYIK